MPVCEDKPGRNAMTAIHHVVTGTGAPPIVFVHGFACAHSDWDAQVAHLSPRHRCVAVDLPGHGASPGEPADCSIERFGADVAALMRTLSLPPSVLVGHSMGCRVVVEAALQAPASVAGLVLVDGSQFAPAMDQVLRERFAAPNGFDSVANGLFVDMFTARSDPAVRDAVVARARRMPPETGSKLLLDLLRYDVHRLEASSRSLRVPVLALQATYSNEKRERATMAKGQSSPYLETVRSCVPSVRVEIVENTGHFPQLDEPGTTNAAIERFVASVR
jgi:pimeloyl-ACP methyl ester carboxylesterase